MKLSMRWVGQFVPLFLVVAFLLALFSPLSAQTNSATFSVSPNEGVVILGDEFYIDINLITNSNPVSLSRIALAFDEEKLQVVKAEYDSLDTEKGRLFCDYPETEDNYIVDNSTGEVVITGFATGNETCPYFTNSSDTGDVFARIHFQAVDTGTATVNFVFNGSNDARYSAIMNNGSPPNMILNSRPAGASFTILEEMPSNDSDDGTLPPTGEISGSVLLGSSAVFLVSMGVLGFYYFKKRR